MPSTDPPIHDLDPWDELLGVLEGWILGPQLDTVCRGFLFRDADAAREFIRQMALMATAANYAPSWTEAGSRVDVRLPPEGRIGLGLRDIAIARAVDQLALGAGGRPASPS